MTVSLSVPATASNLGGGFDCVGAAVELRLWLTAQLPPAGDALTLVRTGTLAVLDAPAADDLIVGGFRAACARANRPLPARVAFTASSDIPVARGLGSSAAAIVAGAAAANALLGLGLTDHALIALGAELEGHPDNVAPAVLGGTVLAVSDAAGALVIAPLRVHPGLRFVFAVPDFTVDTHRARAALPRELPHIDARRAAAASAALVAGLERGDAALLAVGFDGPLHVPYRRALVKGYDQVTRAARAAGALGATLSGSGSSIVAVAGAEQAPEVAAAMSVAWTAMGVTTYTIVSSPGGGGLQIEPPAMDASRNNSAHVGRSSTVEIES